MLHDAVCVRISPVRVLSKRAASLLRLYFLRQVDIVQYNYEGILVIESCKFIPLIISRIYKEIKARAQNSRVIFYHVYGYMYMSVCVYISLSFVRENMFDITCIDIPALTTPLRPQALTLIFISCRIEHCNECNKGI